VASRSTTQQKCIPLPTYLNVYLRKNDWCTGPFLEAQKNIIPPKEKC